MNVKMLLINGMVLVIMVMVMVMVMVILVKIQVEVMVMVMVTLVRIQVARWILTSGQCQGSAAAAKAKNPTVNTFQYKNLEESVTQCKTLRCNAMQSNNVQRNILQKKIQYNTLYLDWPRAFAQSPRLTRTHRDPQGPRSTISISRQLSGRLEVP